MNYKYIVVENIGSSFSIMLTDFYFWANQEDQLRQYCQDNKINYQGILVSGLTEKDVMMFKLAWKDY
jgi:hypothetical protein